MTFDSAITFGDNVRIRSTPDTEAVGIAGLLGQVYGHTTPSVTGVDVIGPLVGDLAINVYFAERGESFWFAPELVSFVDQAPGTEMEIGEGASAKKFIRTAWGDWSEVKPKRGLLRRLLGAVRGRR
jgi:hypothetical protein